MAAEHFDYFEFDLNDKLKCPSCGRVSRASDLLETYAEVADFVCRCGHMIAIVSYPTVEETKQAAAKGNPKALRELDHALAIEAYAKRFQRLKIKGPDELPGLVGERLAFNWDFEEDEGEHWTVIRCAGVEVAREPAVFEGQDRFDEVKAILTQRYGERFAELRPTNASGLYLYGDRNRGVKFD